MSEERLRLRVDLDLGKGSGLELEVGFRLWAGLVLPSNLVKCTQRSHTGVVTNRILIWALYGNG